MQSSKSGSGSETETVVRVRHSPVFTQQVRSDEAGPRPSQEAKPVGPGHSQNHRDPRPGTDIAATQL